MSRIFIWLCCASLLSDCSNPAVPTNFSNLSAWGSLASSRFRSRPLVAYSATQFLLGLPKSLRPPKVSIKKFVVLIVAPATA